MPTTRLDERETGKLILNLVKYLCVTELAIEETEHLKWQSKKNQIFMVRYVENTETKS